MTNALSFKSLLLQTVAMKMEEDIKFERYTASDGTECLVLDTYVVSENGTEGEYCFECDKFEDECRAQHAADRASEYRLSW